MIREVEFWLWLGASVVVFWLLPKRHRPMFLSLMSFAYIAAKGGPWAVALLAWTALFYFLAPLAARRRTSTTILQRQTERLSERNHSAATDGGTATLVVVEVPMSRKRRPWILPLLILAIVGYL